MKKLIIIIFFALQIIALGQIRPPIVTNTVNTYNFIWDTDTIMKDSLVYVRLRPECIDCWDYRRLDSETWVDWFCAENGEPNYNITPRSDSVLRVGKFADWPGENITNTEYYMGFIINEDDSNKVLYNRGDTVFWVAIDSTIKVINDTLKVVFPDVATFDSILINGQWVESGDTVIIDNDSVFYNGNWYPTGDTIFVDIDSVYINNNYYYYGDTIISAPDSLFYDGVWYYSGDTLLIETTTETCLWRAYNATSSIYSTKSISVGSPSAIDARLTLFSGGQDYGLFTNGSYSQSAIFAWNGGSGYGIDVLSNSKAAIKARGSTSYGIDASSATGYSGRFLGGLGLKADSLSLTSGVKLGRLGTSAKMDDWYGTAAEYTANTVKDGVTPQAATTRAYIKD